MRLKLLLMVGLILFIVVLSPMEPLITVTDVPSVSAPHVASPVSQNRWNVYWEITMSDGIRIFNVTYNGILLLRDARIPGVIVSYLDSGCYFYDQFFSGWILHDNIFVEDLSGGSLDSSDQGFQIRGDYDVPGYDYQQIWRFLPDGRFLALLQVGGGGCFPRHVYEARWRFDFAVGGDLRNSAFYYTQGRWLPIREESELVDNGERDASKVFTNWKVTSGKRAYYFTAYDSPEPPWSQGTLLVLQNHPQEVEHSGVQGEVTPYVYRGMLVYDKNNNGIFDDFDDPKIVYFDADNDNLRDSGEPVVYDSNGNAQYDSGETVIAGTAPAVGSVLEDDVRLRYIDANNDSLWNAGETLVYDTNNNGFYNYPSGLGDVVISGPTPGIGTSLGTVSGIPPVPGTPLEDDARVRFIDANGNGVWDSVEAVVYDSDGDGLYEKGEAILVSNFSGSNDTPNSGTVLSDDPRIMSTPREGVLRKDIAVWYVSRHFHDPSVELVFTDPILTGLIFYPVGY